jgi:hypothetical protein
MAPGEAAAQRSLDAAVAAAGGWVVAGRSTGADELVRRRPRALELRNKDTSVLRRLAELEFLNLNAADAEIKPVNNLARLRGLVVDSWAGDLDFARLAALEWLHVTETARGQLDTLYAGHGRLHHVEIGKYPEFDLAPLAGLRSLVRLEVFNSRRLLSLEGVGDLAPPLKALELALCPKLDSLRGIAHPGLESLGIASCNRIDDLAELAGAPALRYLALEQRKTPSLRPLAAHPALEVVQVIGSAPKQDVEALMTVPTMKMIAVGAKRWVRQPGGGFRQLDFGDVGPFEDYRLQLMRL